MNSRGYADGRALARADERGKSLVVEGSELAARALASQCGQPPLTALLGVRSVNTVKRWANEGHLKGYRLGSRVLVSRQSVEQMLQDSALDRQRAYEQGLAAALAPFESSEKDATEATGVAHRGRKPWETRAAAGD